MPTKSYTSCIFFSNADVKIYFFGILGFVDMVNFSIIASKPGLLGSIDIPQSPL